MISQNSTAKPSARAVILSFSIARPTNVKGNVTFLPIADLDLSTFCQELRGQHPEKRGCGYAREQLTWQLTRGLLATPTMVDKKRFCRRPRP